MQNCAKLPHQLLRHSLLRNLTRHQLALSQTSQPHTCRRYSNQATQTCHRLMNRTLIRISGSDSAGFLQGLITNDMRLLGDEVDAEERVKSLYSMMLNQQGRVLYDLLLFPLDTDNDDTTYLIECDKDVSSELIKTVKRYKIRKKVKIEPVGDEYNLYAVLSPTPLTSGPEPIFSDTSNVVKCVPDPRLGWFGHRVITQDDISGELGENVPLYTDDTEYTSARYSQGISEGVLDLPPGNCTPLESNGVFLNGVSFNKGCYIGQELTARTHHTGVIRKRIMPVTLLEPGNVEPGTTVENAKGKNCGKFRNAINSSGLALLRLPDVIGQGELVAKDDNNVVKMEAKVPAWWPRESDEIIKQCLTKPT